MIRSLTQVLLRRAPLVRLPVLLVGASLASGCATATDNVGPPRRPQGAAATWIALRTTEPMQNLIGKLADRRCDGRRDPHPLRPPPPAARDPARLHQRDPNIALGVEWFQLPAQPHLDDFVAGRITEAEMLERTGYFDRWRFDYRLYRPVILYAKENGIPIVGAERPGRAHHRISEVGIEGLTTDEKQKAADIDRSNAGLSGNT